MSRILSAPGSSERSGDTTTDVVKYRVRPFADRPPNEDDVTYRQVPSTDERRVSTVPGQWQTCVEGLVMQARVWVKN